LPNFDDVETASYSPEQSDIKIAKPFFTLKKRDKDSVHKWAKIAKNWSLSFSQNRLREISENIRLYAGEHFDRYDTRETRSRTSAVSIPSSASPITSDIMVNHLYDLTENLVSRITRYKPSVAVLPANSEDVSDRMAAPQVKELIDYLSYINDMETLLQKTARNCRVMGEGYVFVTWDPDKGEMYPDYKEAKKKKKSVWVKMGLKSDEEEEVKNLRIGDVAFEVIDANRIYLQPVSSGKFVDLDWLIREDPVDADYLRQEYPKAKDDIRANAVGAHDEESRGDEELDDYRDLENEVLVYTVYHRCTKHVPQGRIIKFTDDVLLEDKGLKEVYNHGKIPCHRITNLDIPGQLHGQSVYRQAAQLNRVINAMYTMVYRNQVLVGHPKWVCHRQAEVKSEQMGNDITKLEYSGSIPPRLEVYQNTPAEVFNFAQDMTEKLQQIMGVFGVSRGEPPPGVKAGIALQFLNEQENERFNVDVNKHHTLIRGIWLMALEVISQYYDKDDGRMIQIFGDENEYYTRTFDPTILNTKFDVRVQNSSAMPESKAARIQTILDIDERKPIDASAFFEMVDLGIPGMQISNETKAKKCADIENRAFSLGRKVDSPEKTENQLEHWKSHYIFMQGMDYKESSDAVKTATVEHMAAHEMLILDIAFFGNGQPKNPAMVEALAAFPNFPVAFEVPEPPEPEPAPPPAPLPPEAMPPDMGVPPMDPAMMAELAMQQGGGLPPIDPSLLGPLPEAPLPPLPPLPAGNLEGDII